MLTIRLTRTGANKSPFYHIVATDSRSARGGKYIERLGYYNPIARGEQLRLSYNEERFNYWLSVGATTSDRVKTIVKEHKKLGARLGKDVVAEKAAQREKVLQQKAKAAVQAEASAETADGAN